MPRLLVNRVIRGLVVVLASIVDFATHVIRMGVMVKAISDTLGRVGPGAFVGFARPSGGLLVLLLCWGCSHSLGLCLLRQVWLKGEQVARQSLLALRAHALAGFADVDAIPVGEGGFDIARVLWDLCLTV